MLQAEQVLQDRYQLKQKLGQNAVRQTWLAEDQESEPSQSVIVKLLAFGGDVQWDNLKLFEREAHILKQLDHPRIPKYRDYFSIDDRTLWFGLVQEYIPGLSFKELLSLGKRFTEGQVHKTAREILEILIYLHGLNPAVLHRDIKPSNLILGEDQQVYLVDFGAVQDKAAAEGATFTVVGTYGYAPLEQFGGRAVPASDLYALGATLIHLLTGTAPADLPQRDLRIQFSNRLSLNPNFVHWIKQLIEPALERRFQTAYHALEALTFGVSSYTSDRSSSIQTFPLSTAEVFRPADTLIQVNKSPTRLKIHIPSGFRRLKNTPKKFLLAVLLCFLFLFSPVLAVILVALLEAPNRFFTGIELDFDRNGFEIKNRLFDFIYSRKKGVTRLIQDVSLNNQRGSFSSEFKLQGVTIMSKSCLRFNKFDRHLFGQGLTEAELLWLAQEIRDWLAS